MKVLSIDNSFPIKLNISHRKSYIFFIVVICCFREVLCSFPFLFICCYLLAISTCSFLVKCIPVCYGCCTASYEPLPLMSLLGYYGNYIASAVYVSRVSCCLLQQLNFGFCSSLVIELL